MEVKSIYPIINFSDEDEIAVQYERLGADGVIIISPDFSDEAMLIKKIRGSRCLDRGNRADTDQRSSRSFWR